MYLLEILVYSIGLSIGSTGLALAGIIMTTRVDWIWNGRPAPRSLTSPNDVDVMIEIVTGLLRAEVLASFVGLLITWPWFIWPSLLLVPILKLVQYYFLFPNDSN